MTGIFSRLVVVITTFCGWFAALMLFLMMALTFVDVIGRYLLNAPVFGAAEMIQFLLALTVFAGLVLVSFRDEHIAVELVSPLIESRFPRLHSLIVKLATALGLALVGAEMLRQSQHALATKRVSIVLEWPLTLVLLPVTLFCILATVIQLSRHWDGGSLDGSQDGHHDGGL